MFIFGGLSYSGNLSDEYVIAASVSSFLFVAAEWLLLADRITGRLMVFHGITFGSGIMALICLPALLGAAPNLIKEMTATANMLSFFALGFVLLLLGMKSIDTKANIKETEKNEKEENEKEKVQLLDRIKDLEEQLTKFKQEDEFYR